MAEMIRHCPDCGSDRQFEQLHPGPGSCPDSRDGYCPEWSCTACGTGLLIGFIRFMYESAKIADPRVRVA
jgi:hypothetical protein